MQNKAFTYIQQAISGLKLDLSGLVVVTEAATGSYAYTPLIAAMAKAKRVVCVTRDSQYGKARDIIKIIKKLVDEAGVKNVEFISRDKLGEGCVAEADVVTNLSFVRPINAELIAKMKTTAAIPLMFETWEYRKEDVDLKAGWKKGIVVLGTNESDTRVATLDYIGHIAASMMRKQNIDPARANTLLLGKGHLVAHIKKVFKEKGFSLKVINVSKGKATEHKLRGITCLLLCDLPDPIIDIGEKGVVRPSDLSKFCPDIVIIQLAGKVDRRALKNRGIHVIPDEDLKPGYLSVKLDEFGPELVIRQNAAGLKIGEVATRARLAGKTMKEAEALALKDSPAQEFSKGQRKRYGYPFE
jgi:hypothetical protein